MKTIHPFPARMAPKIVFEYLPIARPGERVLDPMSGSGTTLAVARARGYTAFGVDTDPLAITIARANCTNINASVVNAAAQRILTSAVRRSNMILTSNAYPDEADAETRSFIDYWFDARARKELTALSRALKEAPPSCRDFLKCAFSRMIITKKTGVSLGEDVSHSRPHKTRRRPPVYPLEIFSSCVSSVVRASSFQVGQNLPRASVRKGDCRRLPFADAVFDYVITSPPYLNAIDYLRGHKLSLVWLGFRIEELREIRATNIGTDHGDLADRLDSVVNRMITSGEPKPVLKNRLRRYVSDLDMAMSEMRRVSRQGARLVIVVGDCTLKGCDVQNSIAVDMLAQEHGFHRTGRKVRRLPDRNRYLPAPSDRRAGKNLRKRMWNETVLQYAAI